MYVLNLPIDYCATGCTKVTVSENGITPSVDTLDLDAALENTKFVYKNVSTVLWSALTIEKLMNRILLIHYFGKNMSTKSTDFQKRLIESGALTFNVKRRVVYEIAVDNSWVEKKAKKNLQNDFAKVEEYRNAFAHGQVTYDMNNGPTLTYFKSNIRKTPLNDEFWKIVEHHFNALFLSLKGFLNSQGVVV